MMQESGWGPGDAVESELCLLGMLTHADPEAIKGYFQKNLFLCRGVPSRRECLGRILNMTPRQKRGTCFSRNANWLSGILRVLGHHKIPSPPSESQKESRFGPKGTH